jgi:hypothetical protein
MEKNSNKSVIYYILTDNFTITDDTLNFEKNTERMMC